MLTTKDAAQRLGLKTTGAVRQLILAGRLRAEKIGRDWVIADEELERYKIERRGRGRPRHEHESEDRTPERTPDEKEKRGVISDEPR